MKVLLVDVMVVGENDNLMALQLGKLLDDNVDARTLSGLLHQYKKCRLEVIDTDRRLDSEEKGE